MNGAAGTSSGSIRSDRFVKPATSAQRIVASRRSSLRPRATGPGAASGRGSASKRVPQLPQNWNEIGLRRAHFGYARVRDVPQELEKLWSAPWKRRVRAGYAVMLAT